MFLIKKIIKLLINPKSQSNKGSVRVEVTWKCQLARYLLIAFHSFPVAMKRIPPYTIVLRPSYI